MAWCRLNVQQAVRKEQPKAEQEPLSGSFDRTILDRSIYLLTWITSCSLAA
jgi:hypothetical protein